MWRLAYHVPLWFIFEFLVNIPLILLGWIVIPINAALGLYRKEYDPVKDLKGENPDVYHFTCPFMFLWDNWEDGIANDMYWKAPNLFLQIIYWSAIRNPVHNSAIVPIISCKINREKVRFIGSFTKFTDSKEYGLTQTSESFARGTRLYDTKIPHWFYAWQGLYSNFYWQFMLGGKLRRLWIGWKIYPTDIYGVTPYRKDGAGFATQWKVVK